MSVESTGRISASDLSMLVRLLNKSKADELMEDIHKRLPWAHAVWLQRRSDGWIAFVRADVGDHATGKNKTAIEAVTELWTHYSKQGWKQEQETGK